MYLLASLDSEYCISFADFLVSSACAKLQSCPVFSSLLHALYTETDCCLEKDESGEIMLQLFPSFSGFSVPF